jgi:long-chain acyl-CoA synthetase
MGDYDERPWLALYDEGLPADIEVEHGDALSMFRDALARDPDRVLLTYFDTDLTVRDVDALSDALAVGFRDLGVVPGDRVCVFLQNVPQFVLTMLATWKAGAIMVSANPMYKARELAHVLTDSGATLLVALESLHAEVGAAAIAGTSVRAVVTTSELDLLDGELPSVLAEVQRMRPADTTDLLALAEAHRGASPEPVALGLDDIAFLTYTSGTTGPPKGATNTHRNVVFNAQTYRDWVHLDADDVVFGVAPLFHITGLIAHVAIALLLPAKLVLAYRFDAGTSLDLIERHGCTFTVGSITAFIAMMSDPSAEGRDLSRFTKAYSGGAPIAPGVVDRFERQLGCYIHNIYGLTETTSPSHAVPFARRAPVDASSGALSVGVPTFSTVVRVVDAEGRDVPVGEVGEFVTTGPQVVPAYWEKPEETAHALPGGALHTGDVGFMDADGWFYVVDRKKDQINAGGYKIWPREVEDVLYEHDAVREAAVVGVPDTYRGETVKAFVSLRPGTAATPEELIAFCKERMAAFKYPREVEIIDELPKTATGKILRRELRAREVA